MTCLTKKIYKTWWVYKLIQTLTNKIIKRIYRFVTLEIKLGKIALMNN